MKFLIPTILTLLFFSPTPVFADEVSDVGLVCERTNTEIPTHSAFWFKGNQRLEVYIRDTTDNDNDGDTADFYDNKEFSEQTSYSSTDQHIRIYHSNEFGKIYDGWKTKIDRFTLKSTEEFLGTESTSACRVFSSKERFLSELQKIEASLREFLDKRKI